MNSDSAIILVIDDNEINLEVISEYLNRSGYQTITALDGEKGFLMAESQKPDLILLDIVMPGMSGFQVCYWLKDSMETKDIPVIFLTGKASSKDIVRGFALGAVDYITKPFHAEELVARVKTHILLKNTIFRLQNALKEIKTLKGLLPICATCKKIRDDKGFWKQVEEYIREHSNAEFSHSICPECAKKYYPKYKIYP